jgi:hypothetical protein
MGREVVMTEASNAQAMPPGPDPELKQLDRFVGTWQVHGRTLEADADNVSGRLSYEWLPGGFFMQQRVHLDFAGYDVQGLELIGYDPATGRFPSTVFSSLFGTPIPYEWEIEGDDVTIRTDLAGGATFRGKWSPDGSGMSGGWRPNPGVDDPGNVAYDISGTRVG